MGLLRFIHNITHLLFDSIELFSQFLRIQLIYAFFILFTQNRILDLLCFLLFFFHKCFGREIFVFGLLRILRSIIV